MHLKKLSLVLAGVLICTAIQGIAAPKEMMPVSDFEKLILAYKDSTFNKKDLYRFPYQDKAAKAEREAARTFRFPSASTFIDKVLADPSPAVRARAVRLLSGSLFGTAKKNRELAKKLMKTETDPGVRARLVQTFANDGGRDPEIGKFILNCLSDPDPVLRDCAVIYGSSTWNKNLPGLPEKLAELIVNEKDEKTRLDACTYSGRLAFPVLFPAYEKALADPNKKIVLAALSGVMSTWWDFPFFKNAHAEGYQMTLKALASLEPNAALPNSAFVVLSKLNMKSSNESTMKKWAEAATFYNPKEIQAALLPFAKSTTISFLVRNNVFKALYTHGMPKEEVVKLAEEVKSGLSSFYAKSLDNAIKDLK